jgi:hypothetical protein
MTTIDFYTHVPDRLEVAARIIAKAHAAHGSVRVLTPDDADDGGARSPAVAGAADRLSSSLQDRQSDGRETPIWIGHSLEHEGAAAVLVICTHRPHPSSAASSALRRSSAPTPPTSPRAASAGSSTRSAGTNCAPTTSPGKT